MKVKELIEKLKEFDPEMDCVGPGGVEGSSISDRTSKHIEVITIHEILEPRSYEGQYVEDDIYKLYLEPTDVSYYTFETEQDKEDHIKWDEENRKEFLSRHSPETKVVLFI